MNVRRVWIYLSANRRWIHFMEAYAQENAIWFDIVETLNKFGEFKKKIQFIAFCGQILVQLLEN